MATENNSAISFCQLFDFDAAARQERLRLLGLGDADHRLAVLLQESVILPQVRSMMDTFYDFLMQNQAFAAIVQDSVGVDRLKHTQTRYLQSLGVGFDEEAYFNDRLRVGLAHARVGVPLSLYQCAYRLLQQLLLDGIPTAVRRNAKRLAALRDFILKITALDMSLATETYHRSTVRDLERTLTTLNHRANDLQRIVDRDGLTGLSSRRHIMELFEQSLTKHRAQRMPLCLIMADLDHFKTINDTFGHPVGDQVLSVIAQRLVNVVREPELVGRYGGEEFILILRDTALPEATLIAERIRRQVVSKPLEVNGRMIHLSLSLGVACATDSAEEHLLQYADAALYEAKQRGRNQVVVHKVCAA